MNAQSFNTSSETKIHDPHFQGLFLLPSLIIQDRGWQTTAAMVTSWEYPSIYQCCFSTAVADLSSCESNCTVRKAKNAYYPFLYRKYLPTSVQGLWSGFPSVGDHLPWHMEGPHSQPKITPPHMNVCNPSNKTSYYCTKHSFFLHSFVKLNVLLGETVYIYPFLKILSEWTCLHQFRSLVVKIRTSRDSAFWGNGIDWVRQGKPTLPSILG